MSASNTYELAISTAQVKDHIETFLRAGGFIHDHQSIVSMDFRKLTDSTIPMTIGVKTDKKGVLLEI